ncbi:class I SAM-dependent methyltransferase [bacterium]|nr:class I SAM-dependent methyltransferase [bacterium]
MNCRYCAAPLKLCFLDLGVVPPSNAYLSGADLQNQEKTYPLRVLVCTQCWLVQTEDFLGAGDLFRPDYAYFSSTSSSWLNHAQKYCDFIISRLGLSTDSFVVEIGSNDGYLLKNFLSAGVPCVGIEPTASTAEAAEKIGIPVIQKFFGENLASSMVSSGQQADLIVGNNVLAHVPDINDFTHGLARLLKPEGVVTLEFPHLLRLIEDCQFDTVYHEHFSYLSLTVVRQILHAAGIKIWDVEELPSHGGSLRVFGALASSQRDIKPGVARIMEEEKNKGLMDVKTYREFQSRAEKIRDRLLRFLKDCKQKGKKVAAYGAAAKGNTLMNYARVTSDLLPYVCDAAPSKQGKYLPGSRIPIYDPAILVQDEPDFILILPWNIASEVVAQNRPLLTAKTQFITCVPEMKNW